MTAPSAGAVPRWLLHPATVAVALVLIGVPAGWAGTRPGLGTAGALLLVAVAGAAAGFANSGST